MRVHPSLLTPRLSVPAKITAALSVAAVAAALFIVTAARPNLSLLGESGIAPAGPLVNVLVARQPIATGDSLADAPIDFRAVPPAAVPDGALTSLASLEGRVAVGPIAAGAALTASQLGELVAPVPAAGSAADLVLESIAPATVGITLRADPQMLRRGSKAAVVATAPGAAPAVLAAEAWVSAVNPDGTVSLRVAPDAALAIEGLPPGAKLSLLELDSRAPSPFR